MLPTITVDPAQRTQHVSNDGWRVPDAPGRLQQRARDLDEWLFRPSSWFAIDDGNQQVRGVRPATVSAGVDLIGRGRVRALVGRLRPGAAVVDVDVDGGLGEYAAREIASWAHLQGYWTLLRPSGGAAGRHHVFLAHPNLTRSSEPWSALETYLADVAGDIGVRPRQLDLRDAVRPLSSPHRHGAITKPYGDLRAALADLRAVLPEPPVDDLQPRSRRSRATSTHEASASTAGRRRRLRPEWEAYLTTGAIPARLRGDPGGHRRSLIEAQCTLELAWAGHSEQSAWRLIRAAHPAAMTKARGKRAQWWTDYVWARALKDRTTFANRHGVDLDKVEETHHLTADAGHQPPATAAYAVAEARVRLQELLWAQSPRSRAAIGLVGHAVLDRIARTAAQREITDPLRVPCPERDLVLDTGISDRKTIRAALRLLDGTLGTLRRERLSHARQLRASTSYEFEIEPTVSEGVREIPPPKVFHPPRGIWGALPRPAHGLWRALLQGGGEGSAIAQLAIAAALPTHQGQEPTKSHLATAASSLQALARAGLAQVDEHGRWHATPPKTSADPQLLEHVAHRHGQLQHQITAERASYRAPLPEDAWSTGRARAYKAMVARQRAWWDGLDPDVRTQRQRARRTAFDELTITDQALRKEHLARRRGIAGLTEADHHRAWLGSLSPDQYARRSHERQQRYEQLLPGEQVLSVEAWDRHRRRHGLPRHQGAANVLDQLQLLPDGHSDRDRNFLTEVVGGLRDNQPMAPAETLIPDWVLTQEGSAS